MAHEDTMKDVSELQRFIQLSERPNVKLLLETEVQRLLATVPAKSNRSEASAAAAAATQSSGDATATAPTTKTRDTKAFAAPIKSYGWDQTTTAVKIYITLDGVGALPQDQVQVEFLEQSFSLVVENLNGKNHTLSIRLGGDVNPAKSSVKVRKNNVTITLSKAEPGSWSHLTAKDKKADEQKKAKISEPSPAASSEDPSAGIMNLLQKMYEEGDDDMKRNLSKAWTESREKQAKGDFGSL